MCLRPVVIGCGPKRSPSVSSHSKKVTVGIMATVIVIAISLAFISLFSFPMFTGWVSFYLMCIIPIEIVASVTWGTQHPNFAGTLAQPAKGLSFVLVCLVAGLVIAP